MQRQPILTDQDLSIFQLKTRFVRNYLTFAGKNSKDFLLYISGPGVYDSPEVDMELTSVPGKNGDIIRENAKSGQRRFKNMDITYDAFFFDSLPARTAAVKSWLLSPVGYQVLHDTYDPDFFRMAFCTEPDINIRIDFLQLWQTPGYADIAAAERVSLCDTVHVYIAKLGIEVSCKVTETDYDVLLERYSSITLSNASVYSRNSSLSGALGSIRDEAQLATEAINRVETQVTDVRTLSVQQEYFNLLAAGLLGLHYSSGMAEDGSTVRYAHTAEKLEDSAYAWMSGTNGFFISTDGGKTWGHRI